MRLVRIDHVAIHVKDLPKSVAYYKRVFNLEVIHEWNGVTMVGAGGIRLGLFLVTPATPTADPDHSLVMDHFGFVTDDAGLAQYIARLDALGVQHTAIEDIKIAKCVFTTDPDGYVIEVLSYYKDSPPLPVFSAPTGGSR